MAKLKRKCNQKKPKKRGGPFVECGAVVRSLLHSPLHSRTAQVTSLAMSFLFGKGSKVTKVSDLVKAIKDALTSMEKNSKGNEKVRRYSPKNLITSLKIHSELRFRSNRCLLKGSKLYFRICCIGSGFCLAFNLSIENGVVSR